MSDQEVRIVVFGASGDTGRHLLDQAEQRGWSVTAMIRSIGDVVPRDRVSTAVGDVLDPGFAAEAIAGATGVLSALGFRRRPRGPAGTTLYSRSAEMFVTAMTAAGVRRLVMTTSAGVEDHDPSTLWPYEHIVRPLWLKPGYDDMRRAERIVRDSDLDWVLVRPGRLTDGPATGRVAVSPRFRPPHANSISRADLAAFMLDQVVDDAWVRATPTLGTPRS